MITSPEAFTYVDSLSQGELDEYHSTPDRRHWIKDNLLGALGEPDTEHNYLVFEQALDLNHYSE